MTVTLLGIGVGAGLEDLRIDYPRPVRALREAIIGVRGLLAGETVQLNGEMFSIDGAGLVRPPEVPVPISVGTRSPQVVRLAGELADIALVGARHFTPEIARQYYGPRATPRPSTASRRSSTTAASPGDGAYSLGLAATTSPLSQAQKPLGWSAQRRKAAEIATRSPRMANPPSTA